jgi:hypothetical protein
LIFSAERCRRIRSCPDRSCLAENPVVVQIVAALQNSFLDFTNFADDVALDLRVADAGQGGENSPPRARLEAAGGGDSGRPTRFTPAA